MSLAHLIAAIWVGFYALVQFFSLYRLWLFRRGEGGAAKELASHSGISIITSLKSGTDDALQGLDCLGGQIYPGPLEVILVVSHLSDPIVRLAKRKTDLWDPARITVCWVSASGLRTNGLNPRSLKMAEGYEHATHPWLYWHAVDSVIRSNHLSQAMNLIAARDDRFVTSFPVISGTHSVAARLEAVCMNLEVSKFFLMNFARPDGGAAYGASLLFSRALLEKSGGLKSTFNRLTDDMILLKQFKRVGGRCLLSPQVVIVPLISTTLRSYCDRQIRWLMIARHYLRPVFWIAPLFWEGQVLVAAGFALHDPLFLWLGVSVFLLRILQALAFEAFLDVRPAEWVNVVLLPIYDVLLPFFWLLALVLKRITWAGDVMEVGRNGILQAFSSKGSA